MPHWLAARCLAEPNHAGRWYERKKDGATNSTSSVLFSDHKVRATNATRDRSPEGLSDAEFDAKFRELASLRLSALTDDRSDHSLCGAVKRLSCFALRSPQSRHSRQRTGYRLCPLPSRLGQTRPSGWRRLRRLC